MCNLISVFKNKVKGLSAYSNLLKFIYTNEPVLYKKNVTNLKCFLINYWNKKQQKPKAIISLFTIL